MQSYLYGKRPLKTKDADLVTLPLGLSNVCSLGMEKKFKNTERWMTKAEIKNNDGENLFNLKFEIE